MRGYRQIDGSTIWQDGSRTYPNSPPDPPGRWPYPPQNGTPIEVADENTAQSGAVPAGGTQLAPKPAVDVVAVLHGVIQGPGDVLTPYLIGSTLWEDGSRDYLAHKGQVTRASDPPGSWKWPAPGTPTT